MRKPLLLAAFLVSAVSAVSTTPAAAAPLVKFNGHTAWSNTYTRVNPPAGWLSYSWKKMHVYLPVDAQVRVSDKVLEIEIPTADEAIRVRFRTSPVYKGVKVSAAGALQVTHGSVSSIDKNGPPSYFSTTSKSVRSTESSSKTVSAFGSGLGAWRNRPAYFARQADDTTTSVVLAVATRQAGRTVLLHMNAFGSTKAFGLRGNDAWLVANTIDFSDGLRPPCRYPDGRACVTNTKPPKVFPRHVRESLSLPAAPALKIDTAKKKVVRPVASSTTFVERFVPNYWNVVGDLLEPGTYVGTGTGCSVQLTDKNYKPGTLVGTPWDVSAPMQIAVELRAGDYASSTCALSKGTGETGDVRTTGGLQIGLRPGLWAPQASCLSPVSQGEDLLRGVTAGQPPQLSGPAAPVQVWSTVAYFAPSCGTMTRIGD
jgi:hypothetical protein